MNKFLIPCLLILSIGMSACTSQKPMITLPATSVVVTKEILITTPPKPIEQIIPTRTPSSVSPTPAPTRVPTAPEASFIQQCIQMNSGFPEATVPQDILVVREVGRGISLFNFTSKNRRDIDAPVFSAGTSPDGKWLSYETSSNNNIQIVVESEDGGKNFRVPKTRSWLILNNMLWIDNQRIWFPEMSITQPATSIMVLNPFTGEKTLLKTDYPGTMNFYNYGPANPLHLQFGYSSAVYDSTLNYGVYPEFEKGKGFFQTIWDRKSKKAVARVPSSDYYQNLPIWRDSQKQFLIVGFPDVDIRENEWLSVGLDGQIHQITNFGKMGQKYTIENYAVLSPDGKTLAFSLSLSKGNGDTTESTHLFLLNLETGKATDTCLTADKITWSLDGQYLAVATAYRMSTNSDILLIDLKANQNYKFMEGSKTFPVGWLLQP